LSDLLEKEVEYAYSCVTQIKRIFVEDYNASICDEPEHRKLLQSVIENIEEIKQIAKKVTDHEIRE
jgi:retron-type reverse transcriptase